MGSYARFEHYLTTLEVETCPEFWPPSPVSSPLCAVRAERRGTTPPALAKRVMVARGAATPTQGALASQWGRWLTPAAPRSETRRGDATGCMFTTVSLGVAALHFNPGPRRGTAKGPPGRGQLCTVGQKPVKAAKTLGMFRPPESLIRARIERMTPPMDCSTNEESIDWLTRSILEPFNAPGGQNLGEEFLLPTILFLGFDGPEAASLTRSAAPLCRA